MKNTLSLMILIIPFILFSSTWHIKQDGTGNFTTIQEGINASVDLDSLIVYPGTYFENLQINDKAIIIGSLYLTTGDESYIAQTIIDGSENGSVIYIESVENETLCIYGFVIQNGSGYQSGSYSTKGGAMYASEGNIYLEKCIIHDNYARSGGGLYLYYNVFMFLSGNTIKHNRSLFAGGGIIMGNYSSISWDPNSLNNIYLNNSGVGSEIFIGQSCPYQYIVVDTFTVASPEEDYYYIYPASNSAGYPLDDRFSIDVQNGYVEQVDADIFVSAMGSNENDGLSPANPLKTISYALIKTKSDSLNPKTIFIEDGLYSPSLNDQVFPLHMKSYVSLTGESQENTILDVEYNGGHIYAYDPQRDYSIRNMKLINSSNMENITLGVNKGVSIENVTISDHYDTFPENSYRCIVAHATEYTLNNVIFENNISGPSIYMYALNGNFTVNLTNCIFRNNSPAYNAYCAIAFGRAAISCDTFIVNVINSHIHDNQDFSYEWFPPCVGIGVLDGCKVNIINSTIGNNTTTNGASIVLADDSEATIINSILYGDIPREIYLDGRWGPNTLNVFNSLIAGGENAVGQLEANYINWDENTNLDEDPLWLGTGDYPYYLQSTSPCIDAGTLDLPAGIELPQYDLAGNPRIYGNAIDMGAYEWQGVGVEEPEIPQIFPVKTKISTYPNPFNPSTTIQLELAEAGKIKLAVYNIKGQKVKTLLNCTTAPGTYECNWNGKDEAGKSVSSGQYIVKLQQNGKETATKIMLLK